MFAYCGQGALLGALDPTIFTLDPNFLPHSPSACLLPSLILLFPCILYSVPSATNLANNRCLQPTYTRSDASGRFCMSNDFTPHFMRNFHQFLSSGRMRQVSSFAGSYTTCTTLTSTSVGLRYFQLRLMALWPSGEAMVPALDAFRRPATRELDGRSFFGALTAIRWLSKQKKK